MAKNMDANQEMVNHTFTHASMVYLPANRLNVCVIVYSVQYYRLVYLFYAILYTK